MLLGRIKIPQYSVRRLQDGTISVTLKNVPYDDVFNCVKEETSMPNINLGADTFEIQELSINQKPISTYEVIITRLINYNIIRKKFENNVDISFYGIPLNPVSKMGNYFDLQPAPIQIIPYKNTIAVIWNCPITEDEINTYYPTMNYIRYMNTVYHKIRIVSISKFINFKPDVMDYYKYVTTIIYTSLLEKSEEEIEVLYNILKSSPLLDINIIKK